WTPWSRLPVHSRTPPCPAFVGRKGIHPLHKFLDGLLEQGLKSLTSAGLHGPHASLGVRWSDMQSEHVIRPGAIGFIIDNAPHTPDICSAALRCRTKMVAIPLVHAPSYSPQATRFPGAQAQQPVLHVLHDQKHSTQLPTFEIAQQHLGAENRAGWDD